MQEFMYEVVRRFPISFLILYTRVYVCMSGRDVGLNARR